MALFDWRAHPKVHPAADLFPLMLRVGAERAGRRHQAERIAAAGRYLARSTHRRAQPTGRNDATRMAWS